MQVALVFEVEPSRGIANYGARRRKRPSNPVPGSLVLDGSIATYCALRMLRRIAALTEFAGGSTRQGCGSKRNIGHGGATSPRERKLSEEPEVRTHEGLLGPAGGVGVS